MKFSLKQQDCVIEYSVTENLSEDLPAYGIKVTSDNTDVEKLDNIFFTKDEALERCRWLAEKEVAPELFRDIMADIML